MSEQEVVNGILLAIGQAFPGTVRVWRNNSGALKDPTGRLIRFGLTGSADILGLVKGGRFLAIEVKTTTGKQSEAQKCFEKMIRDFGGIYILARNVGQAMGALMLALTPQLLGVEA